MNKSTDLLSSTIAGLTMLYFFTVPFESTLNRIFGSSIKYILIALLGVYILWIFIYGRTIDIHEYFTFELLWVLLVCISLLWTTYHDSNSLVFTYGTMVLMIIVFSDPRIFDERIYNKIIIAYMIGSTIVATILIRFGATGNSYSTSGRLTINIMGIEGGDENQLSAVISPAVIIAFSFYLMQNKARTKFIYGAIVCISLFAQLLTGSRGGLIASLISMVVVFYMNNKNLSFRIIFSSLLLTTAFCVLLLGKLPEVLSQRLFGWTSYEGGSGRIDIWNCAVQAFSERPILGYGLNGWYDYAIQHYGKLVGTHNTYLKVLVDVGIIGFIVFIIPFYKALKYNFYNHGVTEVGILISALISSCFLDVLQVRFLWNALYITLLYQASNNHNDNEVGDWNGYNRLN